MKNGARAGLVAAVLAMVGCGEAEHRTTVIIPGMPGVQGPEGERGPAGEKGAPGAKGEAGTPAAVSGTRLKARWRVGEDGARAFEGWLDSELGVACTWELAIDGKERCLPSEAWSSNNFAFGFSDDQCTKPQLRYLGPDCDLSGGFTKKSEQLQDCALAISAPQRVFKIGAKTASQVKSAPYYSNDNGCKPDVSGGIVDVYDAEELPASSFVAGSSVHD